MSPWAKSCSPWDSRTVFSRLIFFARALLFDGVYFFIYPEQVDRTRCVKPLISHYKVYLAPVVLDYFRDEGGGADMKASVYRDPDVYGTRFGIFFAITSLDRAVPADRNCSE